MTQLIKIVDGVEVPLTPEEVLEFEQESQEWEDKANERLYEECEAALQQRIEDTAKAKQYDDAVACASYKDSTNQQWAAEAAAFIEWRDICYEYAFDYMEKAEKGEIEPDFDDFVNGIPEITWPELEN